LSITAPQPLELSLTSNSGFSDIAAALNITAQIDTSGNPILDGGGNLQGSISIIDSGTPHTYALSSVLDQFGTNLGAPGITKPEFDFVFKDATGDLGPIIGEQVHTTSALRGDFGSGFTSLSAKTDTYPVPEPATLSVLGLGFTGALLRRRNKEGVKKSGLTFGLI
jgi:hypothetical protein